MPLTLRSAVQGRTGLRMTPASRATRMNCLEIGDNRYCVP